jgi:hypothetical protein
MTCLFAVFHPRMLPAWIFRGNRTQQTGRSGELLQLFLHIVRISVRFAAVDPSVANDRDSSRTTSGLSGRGFIRD